MYDYIVGIDIGQVFDPTAACVIRRSMAGGDHRETMRYRLDVVHLERYPLGLSYPAIVARVKALVERPELQPRPRLALDSTGVGRAVTDLLLAARLPAEVIPVTLTGGTEVRVDWWSESVPGFWVPKSEMMTVQVVIEASSGESVPGFWVPKSEVIGTTQSLLNTGRLKIARGLHLADVLRQELSDFRMTVSGRGHESFNAREGAHDDVLLSVAIGCWVGMREEIAYRGGNEEPERPAAD
jgi:hypothetical protein